MKSRRGQNSARILGVYLILGGLLLAQPVAASDSVSLTGRVSDAFGNLLSGVEVLIITPAGKPQTVAMTHSDGQGRFRIIDLVPGSYRVAALKEGYLTFVGQVNTAAQKTFDLVLDARQKLDGGETELVPEDASWALRLPRRSILRDVEAPVAPGSQSPAPETRRVEPLRLQVDQTFGVGPGGREPDDENAARLNAAETRMSVTSPLGERGNLRVSGSRDSHRSANAARDSSVRQSAAFMDLGFSYVTSPDARLNVNAYYSRREYQLSAEPQDLPASFEEEQRSWGWDAGWSTNLGPSRRLALRFDYRDTWLGHPYEAAAGSAERRPGALRAGLNRAVGAEGLFRMAELDRHDLQVAVRAQFVQSPWAVTSLPEVPDAAVETADWSVRLDAQDSWAVTAPLQVVYGLGYRQALMVRETAVVVPRVGAVWSQERWSARALASYHAVKESRPTHPGIGRPIRPADSAVGYEAEVQIEILPGVTLTGGSEFTPVEFGGADLDASAAGRHPLYVIDGNAAVHRSRVGVSERRGETQTWMEVSAGRAEGSLMPLLPFGSPMAAWLERTMQFGNARFGLRLPGRGADLLVAYERIESATVDERPDGPDESVQQAVEMRFMKDLWGFPTPGDWRLLLALHLADLESNSVDEWRESGGDEEALNAVNRRVSAGVSVVF